MQELQIWWETDRVWFLDWFGSQQEVIEAIPSMPATDLSNPKEFFSSFYFGPMTKRGAQANFWLVCFTTRSYRGHPLHDHQSLLLIY